MLPANAVLRAAGRWIRLLENSSLPQASALLRSDSAFTDLSITQYSSALDWLIEVGLLEIGPHGTRLAQTARGLPASQVDELLFATSLEALAPAWLPDSDLLVRSPSELPQDASALADALGLNDVDAFRTVRQVHGRIDLAQRALIGEKGETELIRLLEDRWPGSTNHIALDHDGFGYDIVFSPAGIAWHLEVKTTTRRGRLVIHLSRQEREVGMLDPAWRLIVVGLDADGQLGCIATARHQWLLEHAPTDASAGGRWQSASYEVRSQNLRSGLCFIGSPLIPEDETSPIYQGIGSRPSSFVWMPDDCSIAHSSV